MTNEEKKAKIADLTKRAKNPSLPASAVKKINEIIANLEGEVASSAPKKEKLKSGFFRENGDFGTKPAKEKKAKKEKKAPAKKKKISDDYDCDDIIAKEKERRAKSKKSSKKAESTPTVKKDEKAVEKVVERIEKHFKDGELTKAQIEKLIETLTEQLAELKELLKKGSYKKSAAGGKGSDLGDKVRAHLKKTYPNYTDKKMGKVDDEKFNAAFNEMVDDLREGLLSGEEEELANDYVERYMHGQKPASDEK